jgi:hypothetical protein
VSCELPDALFMVAILVMEELMDKGSSCSPFHVFKSEGIRSVRVFVHVLGDCLRVKRDDTATSGSPLKIISIGFDAWKHSYLNGFDTL